MSGKRAYICESCFNNVYLTVKEAETEMKKGYLWCSICRQYLPTPRKAA